MLFCVGTNFPLQMVTTRNYRFCEKAERDPEGGAFHRSDRVFRPRDRGCRPSALAPRTHPADSNHGRAIRSTDESRS